MVRALKGLSYAPTEAQLDTRQFSGIPSGSWLIDFHEIDSSCTGHVPPNAFRKKEARPTTTEEQDHEQYNRSSDPGGNQDR